MLGIIFIEMFIAFIGWLLFRKNEKIYYAVSLLTTIMMFVFAVYMAISPDMVFDIDFVCDQGIHLMSDGFRKVYSLIITFMWMMTMFLSRDYFRHHHKLSRYFFFNLMTEAATLGIFLSKDLFSCFVFFEVMSFTSFPWVIQEETDGAIRAAKTYLAVAVIGGLTALMGLFLIQYSLGTLELSKLYDLAVPYDNKNLLYAACICILVGFGAKAGMFPLHIWLPKAHPVAPAPASSLLSGVLTKSGIFGIVAITVNIFRFDLPWGNLILMLGTVTMFLGALLALFSIDLKRTLACSSMSQIGFILVAVGMMVLLGHENALAARGAILHMMNHSLFKLVLFMAAGVIYMNLHKLNLNEIQGFGKGKTVLNICFLLAAAGIAGIPGLNGYISKTLIHEAIVEGSYIYGAYLKLIEWIFLISGGLTLAYMSKLYICIFVEDGRGYTGNKKYWSMMSCFALCASAVLIPVLGLSANYSMMSIAQVCMPFFNGAKLEHAIHFYSFENLKGGLISILIGALVYVFVVRKFMIKNGEYVDLWPKGLDLEDMIYRPLLLDVLPYICGAVSSVFANNIVTGWLYRCIKHLGEIISHILSDSVDAIIYLLRLTVYKETKVFHTDLVYDSFTYKLAHLFDRIKGNDDDEIARKVYKANRTISMTTHELSDTLSFALLCMVICICAVLAYVLIIHIS